MPITPFIGVRISWLIRARKSDFARVAASATSRSARSSDSRRLSAVCAAWTTSAADVPAPYGSASLLLPMSVSMRPLASAS